MTCEGSGWEQEWGREVSETPVQDAQESGLVEVVILSGPRRGELVRVDLERQEAWTEEDLARLSSALRNLDSTLVGLLEETRGLKRDFQAFRESF